MTDSRRCHLLVRLAVAALLLLSARAEAGTKRPRVTAKGTLEWSGGAAAKGAKRFKPRKLPRKQFRALFHGIDRAGDSVTSLRVERKAVMTLEGATRFVGTIRSIVGADRARGQRRMSLRDEAPAGRRFVTDTDYWGTFVAGQRRDPDHRAIIRVRSYLEVPDTVSVSDLDAREAAVGAVALADGEGGPFAKLEFKVGRPDESGERDQPFLVDKSGVVLPRSEIALLLESPESYAAHRERLRGVAHGLTRKGQPVNDAEMVDALLERIGALHEVGERLRPDRKIRYRRTAYMVRFTDQVSKRPVEVQLTVDADVQVTDLATGETLGYPRGDRVVEFKIPVRYAQMSNKKLKKRGLHDLVQAREVFKGMATRGWIDRDRGKAGGGRTLFETWGGGAK